MFIPKNMRIYEAKRAIKWRVRRTLCNAAADVQAQYKEFIMTNIKFETLDEIVKELKGAIDKYVASEKFNNQKDDFTEWAESWIENKMDSIRSPLIHINRLYKDNESILGDARALAEDCADDGSEAYKRPMTISFYLQIKTEEYMNERGFCTNL